MSRSPESYGQVRRWHVHRCNGAISAWLIVSRESARSQRREIRSYVSGIGCQVWMRKATQTCVSAATEGAKPDGRDLIPSASNLANLRQKCVPPHLSIQVSKVTLRPRPAL